MGGDKVVSLCIGLRRGVSRANRFAHRFKRNCREPAAFGAVVGAGVVSHLSTQETPKLTRAASCNGMGAITESCVLGRCVAAATNIALERAGLQLAHLSGVAKQMAAATLHETWVVAEHHEWCANAVHVHTRFSYISGQGAVLVDKGDNHGR